MAARAWLCLAALLAAGVTPGAALDEVLLASFYAAHGDYNSAPCDAIQPTSVVLAVVHDYACRQANQQLLQDTGLVLLPSFADTCDNASVALQQAVSLISQSQIFCMAGTTPVSNLIRTNRLWQAATNPTGAPMVAASGAFRGEVGDSINYLLRAFCLPMVGSASSSAEMDDPVNYPYFLRAGASDVYRAHVVFDVLQSQRLYHILLLHDDSAFGMALANQFKNLITYCGFHTGEIFRAPCIETTYQLSFRESANADTENTYLQKLRHGMKASATRVMVVFMEKNNADLTMQYMQLNMDLAVNEWQFIFAKKIDLKSDLIEYSFAVEEHVDPLEQLDAIVAERTFGQPGPTCSDKKNKDYLCDWVRELISLQHLCRGANDTQSQYSLICHDDYGIKSIPDDARHEARNVYNAVMLIGAALKSVHEKFCNGTLGVCKELHKTYTGRVLLEHLLNASFIDDNHDKFKLFGRSGKPVYDVFQYHEDEWHSVLFKYNPYLGAQPHSLFNNVPVQGPNFNNILEESLNCQTHCHRSIIDMTSFCCWKCRTCGPYQYVNSSFISCQNCSMNFVPNENLTGCVPDVQPPLFFGPTAEMYVLIGVSCIGMFLSISLTVYIYRLRDTPMVKASTPDLCFIQCGVQVCLFIVTGLMTPTSSIFVCGFTWTISTTLLTMTHAVFLIKAIRLSRPRFYTRLMAFAVTPIKSSLLMLAGMIASQVLICTIWVLLRPPKIISTRTTRQCSTNNEAQTVVLMILPVALAFGTFYFQKNAIKNKIMFQVRQARIGLAGTLCFIVNYFVLLPLIFLEVQESPENVRSTILMCIPFITAVVSWTTMHLPVAYELFLRKKQNSHEYVSRERSRQFQAGNIIYYVDAMLLNRANRTRTHTGNISNSTHN